ncbi:anti-sigma factor family protein [Tautonia plasticadhaerens]|uniref:Putative zinc-finger domain-containing protein n=1 Tax=Tautonia plasticadhaerens TaxID=2527974 RepID=A0A518GV30_9BACT|nr:zf-HC2 domain-containing protein [Tautonia plasticadhaerens]QDV32439.1 hypothetical protein ElP_02710 [Tautonia plasticadhaerens]
MSQFDETLLSAYLDGELDPESSRRVEEATRADPRLDRMLRELSQVRGLVAGLNRPPETPDVSGAVVDRIARSRARRRAYPSFAAAASLAAAAVLVVSILDDWDNAPVIDGPIEVVVVVPGDPAGSADGAPADAGAVEADGPSAVADAGAGPAEAAGPGDAVEVAVAVAAAEEPLPEDADAIRFVGDLADRPGSMQLTIEAPTGAEVVGLFDEVDDLLRHTVRGDRRYGLIRPEHSGGVGVFALIAGRDEREKLFRRLEVNLADHARIFEPTDAEAPVALLDGAVGLGLELLAAERTAPLREVEPDGRLLANRQDPQHDLAVPPVGPVPPSLPGGLGAPRGVIPGDHPLARPTPAAARDPEAEAPPEEEESRAVFLFIRGDGPGGG